MADVPAVAEPRTPAKVDELAPDASPTQFLAAALLDGRVSTDKMRELLAIQREIKADENARLFKEAMARVQAKMPAVVKRREIKVKGVLRSKFAALEDIEAAIRPIYTAEGFSVDYDAEIESESKITVIVIVSHKSGHEERRRISLPLDKNEYRSVVQNYGATLSYCRRYALSLAFNIVTADEDNDGNALAPLTDEERGELEALMGECGIQHGSPEEARFLYALTIKTLDDLTRGQPFNIAKGMLYRTRRQQAERKEPK